MVLVTFKTLTQEVFKLELDPSQKISDVKQKIFEERGDAVDLQKLLYNGKVLDDAITVGDAAIDPDRFVVCMVTRKKPAAPVATPAAAPPATTAPPSAAPAVPSPAVAPDVPATTPSTAPTLATVPAPEQGGGQLSAEQQTALDTIINMGYPRDQALFALQASNFDGNQAMNILLGGIEEAMGAAEAGGAVAGADAGGVAFPPGIMDALGGQHESPLSALRMLPQFDELRRLVRENPEMLPAVLEQIATANPDLMQLITGHQEEFAALINEPDSDEVMGGAEAEQQLRNRGVARIQVTPEDNAAIERLKSMGFPEGLVVEAYFACEKNEDLAVNYILQRMDEAADALGE